MATIVYNIDWHGGRTLCVLCAQNGVHDSGAERRRNGLENCITADKCERLLSKTVVIERKREKSVKGDYETWQGLTSELIWVPRVFLYI